MSLCSDKSFPPSSTRKKKDDATLRGRRPDLFLQCDTKNGQVFPLVIEVKQAAQTGDGRGDLEKLAFLLRDSLDDIERRGIDVRGVMVYGILAAGMYTCCGICDASWTNDSYLEMTFTYSPSLAKPIGSRCDVYALSLPARTVYKMEKVFVFYTPRSRYDMMSLLTAIEAMNMLKKGIQTTLQTCSRKPLDAPQNWTCPSLGTPQKIPPAAVSATVERFTKRTRMLDPSSVAGP